MEAAVNLLIRPPRYDYLVSQLGPPRFNIGSIRYKRKDFELVNSRGLRIQCSHWEPMDGERVAKQMSCVVYLHGNSGSRMDAAENAIFILHAFRLTFFAFDFAGAGHSEGKYISLGYHEQDDVETVLNHLKSTDSVANICLWGRSMGAATAIMYTAQAEERRAKGDQDVVVPGALILDSPFSSILKLIPEVVDSMDVKAQYIKQIPKKVVGGLLGLGIPILRKAIKTRAEFDIADLEPIAWAPKCTIPAFFVQGRSDTLVRPHHTEQLLAAYGSKVKRRIVVEGGHNTGRGALCLEEISSFLFSSFLTDEERERVSENGEFPRLRVNVENPDVPHFLCRRLPYPLVKDEIKTFDSMIALIIAQKSVQLHQPFTGYIVGEYQFGGADEEYSIRGYGTENIGTDSDQKLFYIRATEPFCESDVILLFLTNRAEEMSDIMKLRIDTLLREKLSNVNMAGRIEQIVQKLVARRIREQVMSQQRKRAREEQQHRARLKNEEHHKEEHHHFTGRLRRNTAKIFALIGGGNRDADKANKELNTTPEIEPSAPIIPPAVEAEEETAAPTLFVGSPSFAITENMTATDSGLQAVAAEQDETEDLADENVSVALGTEKPEAQTVQKSEENGAPNDSEDSSQQADEPCDIHVDEDDIIGTIEEVMCEIGMVSEKDRPHLHSVIRETVREVIQRELENYRRSERERLAITAKKQTSNTSLNQQNQLAAQKTQPKEEKSKRKEKSKEPAKRLGRGLSMRNRKDKKASDDSKTLAPSTADEPAPPQGSRDESAGTSQTKQQPALTRKEDSPALCEPNGSSADHREKASSADSDSPFVAGSV